MNATKRKKIVDATLAKVVEVGDLRRRISLGMGIETASEAASKSILLHDSNPKLSLGDLAIGEWNDGGSEEKKFKDWVKSLLALLLSSNDHSLKFVIKEINDGPGDPVTNYEVGPDRDIPDLDLSMVETNQHGYISAVHWCDALNGFVLDFYGIKKHAKRKFTKKEIQDKVKEIQREIAGLKARIKSLNLDIKKARALPKKP